MVSHESRAYHHPIIGCPPLPRLLGYLFVEVYSYRTKVPLRILPADYPILKLFKPSYHDFSDIVVLRL